MAASFNDSHIRQILQSINIVDLVSSYVSLRRRGKDWVGLCPFHDDSKPSMYVSDSKQIFKCFACGSGGDAIKFMMLREQMTFPEAVIFLAERTGIHLPEQGGAKNASSFNRNDLEKINRWALKFFQERFKHAEAGQQAREYAVNRRINEESREKFALGWAPEGWDSLTRAAQKDGVSLEGLTRLGLLVERQQGGHYDRFRERLIFPVFDPLNRVIAFGGRTLGDDPAKYLNSPESDLFDKSRTLYGLHAAKDKIVKQRKAIIVEGYTDCIMAHQFGHTNVVATLGTAFTIAHAQVLARYADRLVLIFDSDQAGQKAADRAIEVLFDQHIEVYLVSLPTGMDPCDFLLEHGAEAFAKLAEEAMASLEYKWASIAKQLGDTDSVAGHRRLAEEFLRVMSSYVNESKADNISRGYIVNRISKMLNMPVSEVDRRLRGRGVEKQTPSAAVNMHPQSLQLDARGRCEREIIETLLNRPELYIMVKDFLSPSDFKTPELARIAERLWLCLENGAVSPQDIIGGLEDIELSSLIIDLLESGSRRDDYESLVLGALRYIQNEQDDNNRKEITLLALQARQKYGQDGEAALLQEIVARQRDDKRRYPMPGNVS